MSRRHATHHDAGGARGLLLAVSSAALAIAAHGVGGGELADTGFTVLLATLLAWGGASLARRGGLPTLVGVLGVTQTCQHLLLTEVASGHGHDAMFDGWTMFIAHAVATLLTALLLTRAGAALGMLAAAVSWLFGGLVMLVAGPVRTTPVRPGTPLPARPGALLEVLFRQVCPRRGPPRHS